MNEDILEGGLRQGLGVAEDLIGDATGDVSLRLRGKADQVLGRVQSAYGQAKDTAVETVDSVDAFVTERPYMAVAFAAAVGVAFGFILGLGRPKVIVIRPAAAPRS
jgi:uncharacterized protein YjbJ (UPF0337 family)